MAIQRPKIKPEMIKRLEGMEENITVVKEEIAKLKSVGLDVTEMEKTLLKNEGIRRRLLQVYGGK